MTKWWNKPVGPAITTLAFIATLDLVVTVVGLEGGWFGEANPMLNAVLSRWGIAGLVVVKMGFIMCPVAILAWGRTKMDAAKVDTYVWWGAALYAAALVAGVGVQSGGL